jgi:cell division protein FtsB
MAIALALFLILLGRKAYDFYVIHEQIVQAEETKAKLEQEQKELEEKKQELNDPNVIGKKARDELGLVKPGEVPYVP